MPTARYPRRANSSSQSRIPSFEAPVPCSIIATGSRPEAAALFRMRVGTRFPASAAKVPRSIASPLSVVAANCGASATFGRSSNRAKS
jgi:hypothetical protein